MTRRQYIKHNIIDAVACVSLFAMLYAALVFTP